jgi:LETM1 and EF-hand domain-containing protein 1, mitochondrial
MPKLQLQIPTHCSPHQHLIPSLYPVALSLHMSLNRAAHRAAPLLLGRSLRSSRRLPSHVPAIAILIPLRQLSTETSTSGSGSSSTPPPGFNIGQAKKPLSDQRDASQKSKDDATSSQSSASKLAEQVKVAKNEATATPKGGATEAQSLTELAADKTVAQKGEEKGMAKKEEEKKLTIWQKVKKEVVHYWDGTKLLAAEVRISSRLALKMAAGYELTRREHRQVSSFGSSSILCFTNLRVVAKDSSGSWPPGSILSFCHCPLRRVTPSSRT